MRLPGLGVRLEPVGDPVEALLASGACHARIDVGVFVCLASDRGLKVVASPADRLTGREIARSPEIFEMAMRVRVLLAATERNTATTSSNPSASAFFAK